MATETKRQRIRVCLKAYDHKLIDVSAEKIVETAKRTEKQQTDFQLLFTIYNLKLFAMKLAT